MKSTDKFLIGIVAAIVLIIIAALVITLAQPEPTYMTEDTPEGVAHNYLVALNKEDYERAYGYLSPVLAGYPASAGKFAEHVQDHSWNFRLSVVTTLSVEAAKIIGSKGIVRVRESSFRGGDLFNSGQSTRVFDMELEFADNEWKIVDADSYFARCWRQKRGCQ